MPEVDKWFSISWFSPSTFQAFSWEYKFILWLLLSIPVIYLFRWLFNLSIKQKLTIAGDMAFHERIPPIFEDTDTAGWIETWDTEFEKLGLLEAIEDYVVKIPRGDRSHPVDRDRGTARGAAHRHGLGLRGDRRAAPALGVAALRPDPHRLLQRGRPHGLGLGEPAASPGPG